MFTTVFLWITAIGWLGYGLYCLFVPSTLTTVAGLVPSTLTAEVEIRAMYGGLQSAVGVLALIGALRPAQTQGVLLALVCIYLGLCSTRASSAILLGDGSSYSVGAAIFESLSALICFVLLRKAQTAGA